MFLKLNTFLLSFSILAPLPVPELLPPTCTCTCTSRLLMVTGRVAELEAVPKAVARAGPMLAKVKDNLE